MEPTNPYSPPNFTDQPAFSPRGELNIGVLSQIRVVAILMIVQGALCLLYGIMMAAVAIFVPAIIAAQQNQMPQGPGAPTQQQMHLMMSIFYGVMAGAGIIPGILQIYAGIANLRLRGRIIGIVALVAGLLSIGTCYCMPTAIALMVYGMIIYFHETAQKAFAYGEEGRSWSEVTEMAYQGRMPTK